MANIRRGIPLSVTAPQHPPVLRFLRVFVRAESIVLAAWVRLPPYAGMNSAIGRSLASDNSSACKPTAGPMNRFCMLHRPAVRSPDCRCSHTASSRARPCTAIRQLTFVSRPVPPNSSRWHGIAHPPGAEWRAPRGNGEFQFRVFASCKSA